MCRTTNTATKEFLMFFLAFGFWLLAGIRTWNLGQLIILVPLDIQNLQFSSLFFSAMAVAGEHLASEEHSATDGVIKVIKKFLLKSVGWITIYLVGYYNFSMAWLVTPLVLTVLRSQWKSERNNKLMAAREAALTDERTMIESRIRVEDLPSWVFFPDKVGTK